MPAATTGFRRKQTVVAVEPLPGVPIGTAGRVLTVVGLSWERYRVRFDNGVEIGSIDGSYLADIDTPGVEVRGRTVDESTDPEAVLALVTAVVAYVVAFGTWFWPFEVRPLATVVLLVGSLGAVVFGHRSLRATAGGRRDGAALAVTALVLGYLGLLLGLLGAVWLLTN